MKVNVAYDDFLTEDNKQIINNIDLKLNNNITINLSENVINEEKICQMKINDDIGINEMRTYFKKEEIREFIEALKRIYNQI